MTKRSVVFAQVLGSADLLEILLLSKHHEGLNHALSAQSSQDGDDIAYTEDGLMHAGTILIAAGLLGIYPDSTLKPTAQGDWLLRSAVDDQGDARA